MFIRPTKQNIEKIKEIHKEKGFYDFTPAITMILPLHREERYQILAELPITEKPCGDGEVECYHNGVLFGKIHFGSNGYKKHYLYSVQVIEQLYIRNGRRYERISERPLNEYCLIWTSQKSSRESIYHSWTENNSIMYADSLDGLRKQYKERFLKKSHQKIGG